MDLTQFVRPETAETTQEQPAPQYTKEEYAALKKAEREALWTRIDAQAEAVLGDKDALQGFLNFVAQCSPQRVANLLLLHEQNPEIRQVKTFEGWHQVGRSVRTGAEGYTALIGQEYEREDGKRASGYNIGKLFDISQTRGRQPTEPPRYQAEELIAAMFDTTPLPIRIEDGLPDEVQAQYVPKSRAIFVRNGMDAMTTFCAIAREQAHASFDLHDGSYSRRDFAAQSYCAAYVVAQKYGLDISAFDFARVCETATRLEPAQKRAFLGDIRTAAYAVSRDIQRGLPEKTAEKDAYAIPVAANNAKKTKPAKAAERA